MDGKCTDLILPENGDNYEFGNCSPMMKVYCRCGRIIGMDTNQAKLKFSLRKVVECCDCRNARIARDIEELNLHFEPQEVESL